MTTEDDSEILREIWRDALNHYRRDTGHPPIDPVIKQDISTVDGLFEFLDVKDSKFKKFRDKHQKAFSKMRKFLRPIEALSKIGAGLGSLDSVGAPISIVFSAISYFITAGHNVSNAYDAIEEVFADLESYTDRLSELIKTDMPSTLRRKAAMILTFVIRIIGRSESLMCHNRFKEYVHKAFLGEDEIIKDIVRDLKRALQDEQDLLATMTYVTVSKNNTMLYDRETMSRIEDLFFTGSVQLNKSRYTRSNAARHEGTGSWLGTEDLYKSWKQQEAPILWILGDPGSGKTTLSTWLIEDLLSHDKFSNTGRRTHVAYFYFTYRNSELQDTLSMFKTMVWELQEGDGSFQRHLGKVCQQRSDVADSEEIWSNCFMKYYSSLNFKDHSVALVIDGLDEADREERLRLLKLLRLYQQTWSTERQPIQFVIFARKTLRGNLNDAGLGEESQIIVSYEKNREDMVNYITHELQNLSVIKTIKRNKNNGNQAELLAKNLQEPVLKRADGVFLWAKLILNQMQDLEEGQIWKLLGNLPKTLDDMILSIFQRLCEQEESLIDGMAEVLMWVSGSRRELHFGEIVTILQLDGVTTTWMLWDQLRGKFASIFSLRYPRGFNPDLQCSNARSSWRVYGAHKQNVTWDNNRASNNSSEDVDDDDGKDSDDDIEGFNSTNEQGSQVSRSPNRYPKGGSNNLYHYSPDQAWTCVEFTHARFHDVVEDQVNRRVKGENVLRVFKGMKEKDLGLFLSCVDLLKGGPKVQRSRRLRFVHYPTFNMFYHLANVTLDNVGLHDRRKIVDGICWTLNTETGCQTLFDSLVSQTHGQCDGFWRIWFVHETTVKAIQHWLSVGSDFHEHPDIDWMRKAASSLKVLLQKLALTAASLWLHKNGYDDEAYLSNSDFQVWFLKAYTKMPADEIFPPEVRNFNWVRDSDMAQLSFSDIEDLACWADLERTTHWYAGVGRVLSDAECDNQCLEYCEKAIKIDNGAWVAWEARAKSWKHLGNLPQAIKDIQKAMELVPANLSNAAIARHESYCSEWLRALGRHEESRKMAKSAFEHNHCTTPAISRHLEDLEEAKNWEDYLKVLMVLNNILMTDESSMLVEWLVEIAAVPRAFWNVVKLCDQPEFLLEAVEAARSILPKLGNEGLIVKFTMEVAKFIYECYKEDEKPKKLLEEAVRRYKSARQAILSCNDKWFDDYVNDYAQICFDMAVLQHQSNKYGSNGPAKKLKALASSTGVESTEREEDLFEYYIADYPALLYGRWLREYEEVDSEHWRKCFRTRMLNLLAGLDDKDPENDTNACKNLAITLFQAGDEDSAAEILAILFKPLYDIIKGEAGGTDLSSDDGAGDLFRRNAPSSETGVNTTELLELHLCDSSCDYECDCCGLSAAKAGSISLCKICYDKNFCSGCLENLKAGKLDRRTCNPKHDWYQAWPIPPERLRKMAFRYKNGNIALGKEWLQARKKTWQLN